MTRKFSELREKMSPESKARAQARAERILNEMALADLRRARDLTQQQLASQLEVNQAWISKVERQADMYLSTLRAYVTALGGDLEIVAHFPDAIVRIKQFEDLGTSRHEQSAGGGIFTPVNLRENVHQANASLNVWTEPVAKRTVGKAVIQARVWQAGDGDTSPGSTTPGVRTETGQSKAA